MGKRILVLSDRIGRGDEDLGRVLMRNFMYSVARNEEKPTAITLMNDGVRLACEGSGTVEDLRILVEAGVVVRACGTCLDHFGLTDALVVGEIGAMPTTVATLLGADDVVTIA